MSEDPGPDVMTLVWGAYDLCPREQRASAAWTISRTLWDMIRQHDHALTALWLPVTPAEDIRLIGYPVRKITDEPAVLRLEP